MTRIRYRVVAFAMALAAITYLDRVCISVVAPSMMRDLHLTNVQMSYVFSAFTLTYALFEIPTAAWADRVGSRRVLTRIVAWWSAFTLLTASAFNFAALLLIRALFGAGEAGAWPNVARVFTRWIPSAERGRAQGLFFASAHLSGGLTPILIAWLATFLPWRATFIAVGSIGFLWSITWFRWFRDEPRDHKSVDEAEREYIEKRRGLSSGHSSSIGAVLLTPSLAPLCLQYFANTYGFYFFITWLPTYLIKARGMAHAQLAVYAGLPLLLSVLADLSGGYTADRLSRRFGPRVGRSSIGTAFYLLAGACMLCGSLARDSQAAALLIACGGAASMFTLAAAWAAAIDLGGPNSAVVSAAMNSIGQVGGILSPIVLAYVVDRLGNWNLPLQILALLYLIAAVSWIFIRPPRGVGPE